MKIIKVVWEDAKALDLGPWVSKEDYVYEPYLVTTVGIELYKDERGVVITDSVSEDLTGAVHQIPCGMIVEYKELT